MCEKLKKSDGNQSSLGALILYFLVRAQMKRNGFISQISLDLFENLLCRFSLYCGFIKIDLRDLV